MVFLDLSGGGNNLPAKTESAFSSLSPNLLAPTSSQTVQRTRNDFPKEVAAVSDEKLVEAKPQLELIQTQTLRPEEELSTVANKDKQPAAAAEEERKPFQVFRKPTVLQGKLVHSSSFEKPKSRPEQARDPESENSGSVKQEFTAFRKPPRPSGKPRKTLGQAQSVAGDIENNLGSQDNEPEVIRQAGGPTKTTLPEEINTFFSGEISSAAATRKPKTFSAQTFNRVPAETRNGGKGGKQIVFQTPTSSPGRFKASPGSKRVIFQDSTIAVSPGSVPVVPETITLGSLLEDPGPTLQLPFVIEGTAGQTGGRPGAGDDVSIPIVIQEKEEEEERGRGKIKVMTEIEFENQFGRSTTAPSSLGPLQQVVNPLFPFI